MNPSPEDLNLMAEIVKNKYAQLQEQGKKRDSQDAALLGAALVSIKLALKHG